MFGRLGISNAQQSCVPATALVSWLRLNRLGTENIVFWWSWEQTKNCLLGVQKYKILIFGGLGTDSIDY